ncbi:unnamed protein product [Natator depressus]
MPGHLLHLRVCMEGLMVNLVNIYAPTTSPKRPQFYQRVSDFLSTLDSHECLVLGGDFNTILEEQDRSGAEPSPVAANILREIVEHHSLVDVWRDHHPDDTSTFTFVRVEAHRSHHSRLDRIYLSRFHLSEAHSSNIRPAPFSDHHLATIMASLRAERPGPAYWHFNNSLLEDKGFVTSFWEFWLAWREQRCAFPSAWRWWDLGKVRAKLFCRDYTRGTSRRRNAAIEQLEREFYRAFWDIIGPDLATVWAESLQGGVLPLLCRRAVLVLLPKKGDLRDLRNWRPVSLLSTDYKIVAKAISLRLGSMMADVIHRDQTYTVPGRSIFDNLFLVRDLLELGRRDGLSFALLSLDQEKAFDRVDHGYLLGTLHAFGFGPQFVSFLQVLYASTECLVRLNWTLTEPVSFGRGVWQGCPLSGQLYALAIEPFLCLLRRRLTGLVLREPELRLVLSVYADDVLLVVQDLGDLARVEACQAIYSAASSARVNWVKSSGLAVGDWRQVSSLPPALQTIQWSAGPLLYLGVYLSATHPSLPENWQNLEGGVIEQLRKWTRLLRCLSL